MNIFEVGSMVCVQHPLNKSWGTIATIVSVGKYRPPKASVATFIGETEDLSEPL